jgi:hypothetical protein
MAPQPPETSYNGDPSRGRGGKSGTGRGGWAHQSDGVIYIPPECTRYVNSECYNDLELDLSQVGGSNKYICLLGDFNARIGTLKDYFNTDESVPDRVNSVFNDLFREESLEKYNISRIRSTKDATTNNFGYKFVEFCKCNNLSVLNGRFGKDKLIGALTCKDSSIVDYAVVSSSMFDLLLDFEILEFCHLYSDVHCPLTFSLTRVLSNQKVINYQPDVVNDPHIKLWDRQKSDVFITNIDGHEIERLLEHVNNLSDNTACTENNINMATDMIEKIIIEAAKASFGVTKQFKTNVKSKPWFNHDCKTAKRKFHLAKRIHAKQKSERTKRDLHTCSKVYKSTIKRCIKLYKRGIVKKLSHLRKGDLRQFWNIINDGGNKKECNVPVSDMYNYFKGQSDVNVDPSDMMDLFSDVHGDELLNSDITEAEVLKAAKKLKSNKAPGCDLILNEHITCTMPLMLTIYTKLFNAVFSSGIVPEQWLIGVINPIYKNKGDPLLPENYRPITI